VFIGENAIGVGRLSCGLTRKSIVLPSSIQSRSIKIMRRCDTSRMLLDLTGFAFSDVIRYHAFSVGVSAMRIASPRSAEDDEQREAEWREAMRDQFLDKVSSNEMYAIAQEALAAGWGLQEVQRAIDALVEDKAREAGAGSC
jgi:hypothetical protein